MAANDYYRQSYMAQSSQPQRPQPQYPQYDRRRSHIALAYNPGQKTSTFDQSDPGRSYGYNAQQPNINFYEHNSPSSQSQYSDAIPLKHNSRLNTNPVDWQNQPTQYPPSPESPTQPQLLPKSNKKKKKDGWFSGKIPWVVYILSLVQITVFIVEIIKNCECLHGTIWIVC